MHRGESDPSASRKTAEFGNHSCFPVGGIIPKSKRTTGRILSRQPKNQPFIVRARPDQQRLPVRDDIARTVNAFGYAGSVSCFGLRRLINRAEQ
jgi:hypothetical protein